jgi:hypothetical protein
MAGFHVVMELQPRDLDERLEIPGKAQPSKYISSLHPKMMLSDYLL